MKKVWLYIKDVLFDDVYRSLLVVACVCGVIFDGSFGVFCVTVTFIMVLVNLTADCVISRVSKDSANIPTESGENYAMLERETLAAYQTAINEIDDYFEYRSKSSADKWVVDQALNKLTNTLRDLANN